jgi:hypothetical protein
MLILSNTGYTIYDIHYRIYDTRWYTIHDTRYTMWRCTRHCSRHTRCSACSAWLPFFLIQRHVLPLLCLILVWISLQLVGPLYIGRGVLFVVAGLGTSVTIPAPFLPFLRLCLVPSQLESYRSRISGLLNTPPPHRTSLNICCLRALSQAAWRYAYRDWYRSAAVVKEESLTIKKKRWYSSQIWYSIHLQVYNWKTNCMNESLIFQ